MKRCSSAANEVAVAAFLAGRLGFLGIVELIEAVVARHSGSGATALDDLLEADRWARETAESMLARGAGV